MYICKYMKYFGGTGTYICPYMEKTKEWRRNVDRYIKVPVLCPNDVKFNKDGTPVCCTLDTYNLEEGAYI